MKNQIDIEHGRYWDRAWSLVDGCTPCSLGCEHCWSATMAMRFGYFVDRDGNPFIVEGGKFTGEILTHPNRLSIPLKTQTPTVFAVWNDLFHEAVPFNFIHEAFGTMRQTPQHTYLIITKRASRMAEVVTQISKMETLGWAKGFYSHLYFGLTVCNQEEADAKIPVFLKVPGKKFLNIEPMLSMINLRDEHYHNGGTDPYFNLKYFSAVILGGETGPGARPMHPDWVRSVRDQCAAAGVPFFFKGWGEHVPSYTSGGLQIIPGVDYKEESGGKLAWYRRGKSPLLDGRTHDDLPWVTP